MPPKVADWLMSEGSATSREIGVKKNNKGDINCIFRPFNMHVMEVNKTNTMAIFLI